MNVQIPELLALIGEQQVEIRLLRQKLAQAEAVVKRGEKEPEKIRGSAPPRNAAEDDHPDG